VGGCCERNFLRLKQRVDFLNFEGVGEQHFIDLKSTPKKIVKGVVAPKKVAFLPLDPVGDQGGAGGGDAQVAVIHGFLPFLYGQGCCRFHRRKAGVTILSMVALRAAHTPHARIGLITQRSMRH
jgi:hypothetical protein